ncbi:MAG: 1,4-dihydroxy-6-naphthoate synthase [Deltaproteobacteria bacterium]|nr:1,4-dihydroxy-6-naphthoate synthase [Deltaproteobacteria bacterium]
MNSILHLGYSPCPNDTFIFFALAEARIPTHPLSFRIHLADVEVLNQSAARGTLDVTKVSIHAVTNVLQDYWMLAAGGAMGRGCGPLVVARKEMTLPDLRDACVAVPGRMTTAHLLLQLQGNHRGPLVEMPFDRIMAAVVQGEVDAGVIIHESRFTYPQLGLRLVLDLGAWWEEETGLPLPLGGIVMKRGLERETARMMEDSIRRSILYAHDHREEAWPYIRSHAQEMDPLVMQQHIDMFVNEFSLDLGSEGRKSVRFLLGAAAEVHRIPLPPKPVFWDEE